MSDVDRLLAEYIAEHRAGGEADPRAFLSRASPAEQRELASLIDAYLARAPRQSFDQASFRGSSAERTVDELERALGGQAGLWPALLPRLRDRAGLKRCELVERLADALGVGDRKDKVADYYHEMEQGLLPARGVSDRVLDALARDRRRDRPVAQGRRARSDPAGRGTGGRAGGRVRAPRARRTGRCCGGGHPTTRAGRVGRGRRAVPRRLTSGSPRSDDLPRDRPCQTPAIPRRSCATPSRRATGDSSS